MKSSRTQKATCVLCGENPAVTREHVPPKTIFPEPRPSNLITVPACFRCNNGSSVQDERFGVYMSMQAGAESPVAKKLWHNHTRPSVRHNKRLQREILGQSKPVETFSPGGIYLGVQYAMPVDLKTYRGVIEKTVRGLYYHHFKVALKKACPIQVAPQRWAPESVLGLVQENNMPVRCIGESEFLYAYGRASDDFESSVWIMCFHKRHWSIAFTGDDEQSNNSLQGRRP